MRQGKGLSVVYSADSCGIICRNRKKSTLYGLHCITAYAKILLGREAEGANKMRKEPFPQKLENGLFALARAKHDSGDDYVLAFDGRGKFATWHIYRDEGGKDVTVWGHYFETFTGKSLDECFEDGFRSLLERSGSDAVSYAEAYTRFRKIEEGV